MEINQKIKHLEEMLKKCDERKAKILSTIECLKTMSKTRVCPLCKKEFKPKRLHQIYCCSKCSKTMYEIITRDKCIERARKSYYRRKELKNDTTREERR